MPAFQGSHTLPQRSWGIAVQLYGIRSHRNWGHGDFTDLANLIDIASELGASAIGLNPLHALFDDRAEEASPYFPSSRLFLNPLYIDVEAIPEFPRAALAEFASCRRGVEAARPRRLCRRCAMQDQGASARLRCFQQARDAKRAGSNSTNSNAHARRCCNRSPRSRCCADASASHGGNGRSSCASPINRPCVLPYPRMRMSSTTTPSCNGSPISSSRPAGTRRKTPACRSGFTLILPSASARTASMPGAIRISFCRRSRLALRPTSSTRRASAGASPGSIP